MIKGSKQWIDAQMRLKVIGFSADGKKLIVSREKRKDTVIPNCPNKSTCGYCIDNEECIEDV